MWIVSAFTVLLAVCGLWVLEMAAGEAERRGWGYAVPELVAAGLLVVSALIIASLMVNA